MLFATPTRKIFGFTRAEPLPPPDHPLANEKAYTDNNDGSLEPIAHSLEMTVDSPRRRIFHKRLLPIALLLLCAIASISQFRLSCQHGKSPLDENSLDKGLVDEYSAGQNATVEPQADMQAQQHFWGLQGWSTNDCNGQRHIERTIHNTHGCADSQSPFRSIHMTGTDFAICLYAGPNCANKIKDIPITNRGCTGLDDTVPSALSFREIGDAIYCL
jgi:hypothetical protein